MGVKVTWLSHSGFQIKTEKATVLIDPYLSNPLASATPESIDADFIILTHGHSDHSSDVPAIAKRTGAIVIANFEVASWMGKQGIEKTSGHNPGGGKDFGFGRVEFTHAIHSSSMPDGSYGGVACGVILFIPGLTIYHAGDTCVFSDMAMIGAKGIDLAMVPIGDHFTMGPDDSIKAIQFIKPRYVMPVHYNTFPPIEQDASAWAAKVSRDTQANAIVLDPGGSREF
jgi:L-ascorbate metabolism protein UlaG (beta-lactamase superfamily)